MKQYGTAQTNNAHCAVPSGILGGQMKLEAIVGRSYDKLARNARRSRKSSAVAWWREQVRRDGMPNQYHCGGVE